MPQDRPGEPYEQARIFDQKLQLLHRLAHSVKRADTPPNGVFAILGAISQYEQHTGQPQLHMGHLGHMLHRSMPSVTRSVSQLEHEGLVVKSASSKDRRRVYLTLTDKGRETLERACETRFSLFEDIIGRLGEQDTRHMLEVLDHLAEIFEELSEERDQTTRQERNPPTL